MPLIDQTFREVIEARKLNPFGVWGYYKKTDFSDASGSYAGQRLQNHEYFLPGVQPVLKDARKLKYFAIGSCFAREIEKYLITRQYSFLSEPDVVTDEPVNTQSGSGAPFSTYFTKYSIPSIQSALEWAFERSFGEAALSQNSAESFFDLYSHTTLKPVDMESSLRRREKVDNYTRRLVDADVVVLTFGLCECWKDLHTGLFLNVPPSGKNVKYDPERYRFCVCDYEDVTKSLDRIYEILTRHGKQNLQIVCTVSPVALGSTFTLDDVVVANSYSKSLNRVAVEYWSRKHENVHYFPSYEMVMYSDPKSAWQEDRRHPSREMVNHIMNHFEEHFICDSQ